MIHFYGEVIINRPVEEVFDFVADARNESSYNRLVRNVEKLTPGPIGAGTRFHEETVMFGRSVGTFVEQTAYERPHYFGTSIEMSVMSTRGILSFEPVHDGTRMRWTWDVILHGFLKLLTPLIARTAPRVEQGNWANLKRFLEAQPSPLPRASDCREE